MRERERAREENSLKHWYVNHGSQIGTGYDTKKAKYRKMRERERGKFIETLVC